MTEQNKLEKLRSDFIANVSHELRTPIAMLQGYTEAIIDDVVSTEEERNEMIRIIYDESKRMGRLVTDLIGFSKNGIRNMTLYKENVADCSMSLNELHKNLHQVAKENKYRSEL